LKYLIISSNPGSLAGHDDSASIGWRDPSINFQDAAETHPRKSRPSATAGGVEPIDQKATPHTI
jgi:hypothetical protein